MGTSQVLIRLWRHSSLAAGWDQTLFEQEPSWIAAGDTIDALCEPSSRRGFESVCRKGCGSCARDRADPPRLLRMLVRWRRRAHEAGAASGGGQAAPWRLALAPRL